MVLEGASSNDSHALATLSSFNLLPNPGNIMNKICKKVMYKI